MAKKVNWTFPAMEMLSNVFEYIAEFNEFRAEDYIEKIFAFCENFAIFPESNPICRFISLQSKGYRCAIFDKQYIIVYRVSQRIDVLAIIHSSQSPEIFDEVN